MKFIFSLLLSFFLFSPNFAQIIDPFAIRYQINHKGGLVFLSNTSLSCSCAANDEMPPGGSSNNNGFSMNFVDIDSDASTFMSSSDQLNLANCSEIVWAGLYWNGILNDVPAQTTNFANRNKVKLSVNGAAYLNITAEELQDNTVGKISYFAYKDITSIVQANPINATYRVANVVSNTGTNTFGGWSIVVVYRNVFESMKNITVFDGLANVSPGAQGTVNIGLNGFLTPPSGAVNFELGVVAHDGDRGDSGDQLEFNGSGTFQAISDAVHPANNAYNSTIARNGVLTPFRNPSFNNNLGYDANIYSPDNSSLNFIGNSASTAQIRVSTQSETILTSVITSAIDIYEPDLRSSTTYTDLNGGTVQPGDVLEYTITAKNIGSDISTNTYLTDTLDARLTYVPGTLSVNFGPNTGPKTDALDADQAEFIALNNVIRARIGTGANGVSGGLVSNSLVNPDITIIKFRVQLSQNCLDWQCGSSLLNKAYLFGTGQISGIENSNNGVSDLLDQNGCPSLESALINVDVNNCAALTVNYDNSVCIGDNISFTFLSDPSLTLSWTGPNGFVSTASNPTIANAQLTNAGDYVLNALYNGEVCFEEIISPLTVSANPTIQLTEIINNSCFNSTAGSIEINGQGAQPITYSWSNGDQDNLAQNLAAGNYSVTITDANSCTATQSFSVSQPAIFEVNATITSNFNGFNISCFGANDGAAASTVTGGVGQVNISWLPNGETSSSIQNLTAGMYIITATDANNCVAKDTVTLIQPTQLILSGIVTDILCAGNSTGEINTSISGGTGVYTFLWSNNALTEDISSLSAGNYSLNILDQNSCEASAEFTIIEPSGAIVINLTSTEILCNGGTGNIDLSVNGGIVPYSYLWSTGAITEDLQNVTAGNYTITVTDANNCTQNSSITLLQPTPFVLSESHINPVCQNDSRGLIDLNVSGATPAYTYQWNNGQITQDINELFAGTYFCTVTDANNCSQNIQVVLTDPDAVILSETHQNVLCYGQATGSINLSIQNGNSPFNIEWNTTESTEDISNLSAGLYFVNIIDNNNCGGFISTIITEPDTLIYVASSIVSDVSCFNGNNGAINISVSGGTSPYSYLWSNGAITEDISALTAGNYSVTITDNNNCIFQFNELVNQATQLIIDENHVNVLCFGESTGSIAISVSGGNSPYSYSWNNGSQSEDLATLSIGTYTLTVSDANLCTETVTVEIAQPDSKMNLIANSNSVLCFGQNSGSIDLTVSGGTPVYSYLWSNGQQIEDATDLLAGSYEVIVSDNNNCKDSITVEILEPESAIELTATSNAICFGAKNGEAQVFVTGGTAEYSYSWNNSTTDTLTVLSGLEVGIFSVVVTDANGCKDSISVSIIQPDDLEGCVALIMPNIFTPNNDLTNDYFVPQTALNIKEYNIIILNRWGNLVYEGNSLLQGWDGTFDGENVSEGVYFWKVNFTDNYQKSDEIHGNLMLVRD